MVSRRQLERLGVSRSAIATWAANGRLHRLHRGVYAVGHRALGRVALYRGAVLACGDGALLSHASAADLLGIWRNDVAAIHVTVRRGGQRDRHGIVAHRPSTLRTADRHACDGVPCTSVARTLVDLAAGLRKPQLERIVERAMALDVLDVMALEEVLGRVRRARGVRALRACLGPELLGASRSASELERRFLALCAATGLPMPLVNHHVEVAPGTWLKVDFLWPTHRLVVETDGWATHGNAVAARRDRRRDRELRGAGYRVERFMWDDVIGEPEAVALALRPLLSHRGTTHAPQS